MRRTRFPSLLLVFLTLCLCIPFSEPAATMQGTANFSTNPLPPINLGPSAVGVTTPVIFGLDASFQVVNSGSASLNANFSVSPSEINIGPFTTPNPVTVGAGSNVRVGLQFTPAAAGIRTGQFISNDNAPGSPHTVQLTGVGVDVPANDITVIVDPGQATPVMLTRGATTQFTVWALTGSAVSFPPSASGTAQCSGGPVGATCSISPNGFFDISTREPFTVSVTVPAQAASAGPALRIFWWGLPAIVIFKARRRGKVRPAFATLLLVLFFLFPGFLSCGGGSNTPSNPLTVTVVDDLTLSHTSSIPVTVQ